MKTTNAERCRKWAAKNKEKKKAYFAKHHDALMIEKVIERLVFPERNKESCKRYRAKKKLECEQEAGNDLSASVAGDP